jgi:hypothetical protein
MNRGGESGSNLGGEDHAIGGMHGSCEGLGRHHGGDHARSPWIAKGVARGVVVEDAIMDNVMLVEPLILPSKLEVMLKDFMVKQSAFNKSIKEKLGKIDILASKVDSIAHDVELLKLKVLPNDVKENNVFATANAIQVRINKNVRLLAELHARWEREDEIARNMKVCTITTSNDVVPNASNPLTLIGVEKTPTPCVKKPKTAKTFSQKSAKIF